MKQITHFDEQLKTKIKQLESSCEQIISQIKQSMKTSILHDEKKIIIEFLRLRKGKFVSDEEMFETDYESLIEIGLEGNDEYFPNAYIPIWKCKLDSFQKLGYITNDDPTEIEKKVQHLVHEIIAEQQNGRN